MMHLTTNLCEGWGKGEYKYMDDENFSFDEITSNERKLTEFLCMFKEDMANYFHTVPERIFVREIVRSSILVKFFYAAGPPKDGKGEEVASKPVEPHLKGRLLETELLFSKLQLSKEDFNPDGDIDFTYNEAREDVRGYFPYYQPAGWIRYGL